MVSVVRVRFRSVLAGSLALLTCCSVWISPASASPGRARPAAARPLTLEWVGDIALSAQRGNPKGGLARALSPVAGELHQAELTLGNLEGSARLRPRQHGQQPLARLRSLGARADDRGVEQVGDR
jgi:hypothetical protein